MNDAEALTIVIGYDGSDPSRRGLARVHGLGRRVARVVVVTVEPDLRSAGLAAPLAGGHLDTQGIGNEALEVLGAGASPQVEIRTTVGDPASILVEAAREVAADLLVVGRRGGDFVARTLLGSVAERVVQQAPCDVLVVA
jgi:nucleotide-binding universal stress UspA family protein